MVRAMVVAGTIHQSSAAVSARHGGSAARSEMLAPAVPARQADVPPTAQGEAQHHTATSLGADLGHYPRR